MAFTQKMKHDEGQDVYELFKFGQVVSEMK